MKEFMEKLVGRLEEYLQSEKNFKKIVDTDKEIKNPVVSRTIGRIEAYESTISIVNQLAEEYKLLEKVEQLDNGWIPCITALPEEKKVYLEILDIWSDVSDCVWVTLKNSEVAHAYMENGKWYYSTGIIIETDVIAWKPLDKPAPYQPKENKVEAGRE